MELVLQSLNAAMARLVAILLFSLYYVANKYKASYGKKLPPEPPGAWPLIGHFHLLLASQLPYVTLGAIADKLGPIFTIRLGLKRALIVSSPEVAKEIFSNYDAVVSSRPPLVAAKYLTYDYAMFPFTPEYGSYWRQSRKTAAVELLSNRALEQYKHVMVEEVAAFLKRLYESCTDESRKLESGGGISVDFKKWFGDLNLNVIARMVIGKGFFGDGGDEEAGKICKKAISELFYYWGMLVLRDAVPFLGWLDFGGHEKEIKRRAKELDEIAEGWLEEHKQKWASGKSDQGDQKDFMDVLNSLLLGKGYGGFDADTNIKASTMAMIAGGGETTTVALTWALTLLLNNKHEMQKAVEELDKHVGKERMVKDTDISKLVYIQAIMKEAFRLYPPASIPAPRLFTQDCTVGGYFIPKGTWLFTNLKKIHTDPQVWGEDSLEFKPERFLTTHQNVDVRGLNHELTPFGTGRRACPAASFSIQMVTLTLASLLHAFDLSTEGPLDMTQKSGLTNIRVAPLQVMVSPRLPSTCFQY